MPLQEGGSTEVWEHMAKLHAKVLLLIVELDMCLASMCILPVPLQLVPLAEVVFLVGHAFY